MSLSSRSFQWYWEGELTERSLERQLQKLNMEYYLTIKRNEFLIHVTHEGTLKIHVKWKKSDTKGHTYCIIPFIWHTLNSETHKVHRWLPETKEREEWKVTAARSGVSFWGDESVLEWDWGSVHNSVNTERSIEFYVLNGWTLWYVNYMSIELLGEKITTQNHIVTPPCRGLTESLCLLQDNLS